MGCFSSRSLTTAAGRPLGFPEPALLAAETPCKLSSLCAVKHAHVVEEY